MVATIPEKPAGAGTRGAELMIGEVALAVLSSGAAVALINVLRSYFDRSSSRELEFERSDGNKLKISTRNVHADEIEQTFDRAREFFGD